MTDHLYTLYGRPGSGSAAVEALLAILGLPYRLVEVAADGDGPERARLLEISPLGLVPVLELPDGTAVCESAAIMLHLVDLDREMSLAPAPGTSERALWLRTLSFLSSTIYPAMLRYYYSDRFSLDPAHAQSVRAAAARDLDRYWTVIEGWLPDNTKAKVDALDLYAAMIFDWNEDIASAAADRPRLSALVRRTGAHPAVAPVWRRHGNRSLAT